MNKCKFCDSKLSVFSESYLRCEHCDILISNISESSYDEKYYYVEDYRSEDLRYRAKQLFKCFKPYLKNMKCLDFGCNDGSFVLFSRKNGIECFGTDINKFVMEKNKSDLPDVFFYPNEITSKFSCITAFDVIEHFDNINDIFYEIERYLDNNGILIMTTPNLQSKWIKIYKNGWHGYGIPEYHRYIFSNKFLNSILISKGYEIVNAFTTAPINKNGHMLLIKSGYRLRKKKSEKLLHAPISIMKYFIGKFKYGQDDTICIVAKNKRS